VSALSVLQDRCSDSCGGLEHSRNPVGQRNRRLGECPLSTIADISGFARNAPIIWTWELMEGKNETGFSL
jgi:hypothetical protein